jgi:ketosteroid isomerase-like protein
MNTENEVVEIINRETKAWSEKSVELLLSIFHPDMVWVWPTDPKNFDPISWALPQGKFDYDRYYKIYTDWFSNFDLIKNERRTEKILVSKQGDAAFAVVDIDTLWRSKNGEESHWFGRTGKTYVKTPNGWKIVNQVGVFNF